MSKRFFKAFYWIKILSKFVSVQLIVQALNLASGILIVRTLSKQEYAYFTLANSMQVTMNLLADSGISSALSAIGGRIWQDPYRFGQLINTAMQSRRYLAVIAIVLVTPIMCWMLLQNGASLGCTVLLIIAILIELNYYINKGVLDTVLQLHSQIEKIQRLNLLSAISRLIILLGGYTILLNAVVGAFASTIASGLYNLVIWRWVKNTVNLKAPISKDDQKEILKLVKHQAPNGIFFCVQSQLTIWLISIFGNTDNIAEIGALGRIGIIFTVINAVMNSIILPGFARCQSVERLYRQYWQILGSFSLFSVIILISVAFFPTQILSILGKQYVSLQNELFFTAINSVFSFFISAIYFMNVYRGWVEYSWLNIPCTIIVQVILINMVDLRSIKGVLFFNILSAIP
ncbi:lipopolysaccharide biosynthesis protein, partial [uncultured Nostoc sp.]|uniref:lipopolysaccharide biosynthesis protein n=1 Tax=uncultured Nostoc sp. TaxID=340711 RepID=UPI0035C944C3